MFTRFALKNWAIFFKYFHVKLQNLQYEHDVFNEIFFHIFSKVISDKKNVINYNHDNFIAYAPLFDIYSDPFFGSVLWTHFVGNNSSSAQTLKTEKHKQKIFGAQSCKFPRMSCSRWKRPKV